MKKEHVSWASVEDACYGLIGGSKGVGSSDLIIAIGKGGLIPGTIIANRLDIKLYNYGLSSYDSEDKQGDIFVYQHIELQDIDKSSKILVIDDILDTGETLKFTENELNTNGYHNLLFRTIHRKTDIKNQYVPNNFESYEEISSDVWIYYPWE